MSEQSGEKTPTFDLTKIDTLIKTSPTPFLAIDLDNVAKNYDDLRREMPDSLIYYAVKANPLDEVITLLKERGSYFDVASIYEIDQMFRLGVPAERMSYGNTIKKEDDIKYAFDKGIRLFTSDSLSDIEKIARQAPGSRINFRVLLEGSGADWPLSKKFGAHPDMVYGLILEAYRLGLEPYGVSFHVGSQQRDIGQWDSALALVKYLFDSAEENGIKLKCINLGGGFPGHYLNPTKEISTYAELIRGYIDEDFGEDSITTIIEPGRSMVADSGVIVTEVVMVSNKSETNDTRWVYIDIGKFSGLIETIDEMIKFPISVLGREDEDPNGDDWSEVVLAGPTCDSMDILYENHKYRLPNNLKEGDKLVIMTTGAYTMSYSAICFNGFPPLKAYVVGGQTEEKK